MSAQDRPARNYHFIGIGGSGMNVIAQLFIDRGWPITGSDQSDSKELRKLRAQGVECWVGTQSERIPEGSTIVHSTAVRPTNPERAYAAERGWPILHRSQALALASEGLEFVAVAGAHGKTTTSGLLATLLTEVGADPSYAVGGQVKRLGTGGHLGKGKIFVAETDESDKSFLNYRPDLEVVTNIEDDHLVNYGNLQAIEDAFYEFALLSKPGGRVLLCVDSPACLRLAQRIAEHRAEVPSPLVYGYGQSAPASLPAGVFAGYAHVCALESRSDSVKGTVRYYGQQWRRGDGQKIVSLDPAELSLGSECATHSFTLPLPGEHNVLNATAALSAGMLLGFSAPALSAAFSQFGGIKRRFDLWGVVNDVRVLDDYAHHPTELEALIRQAKVATPHGKVRILFQPHLFSRTREHAAEFARVLQTADHAVLTDIMAAREDPDPNTTTEIIVSKMAPESYLWVGDMHEAAWQIGQLGEPGDVIITSGCGNIWQAVPTILESLQAKYPSCPVEQARDE